LLYDALTAAGLRCRMPQGAYYITADIGHFGFKDDYAAASFLLEEVGIASVPGSSFYHRAELGRDMVRFTFSKSDDTLARAAQRLAKLGDKLRSLRR
ncbi:MAG: aminotransferase class I/II-fold pyridoxal phosphate-dependent enzyme, partial [Candidatus Binataceae bacterium]